MKQILRFKSFLILALLAMVGVNSVWADGTTTSTFTKGFGVGTNEMSWTSSKTGGTMDTSQNNRGCGFSKGGTYTLTANNQTNFIKGNIKKVSLTVSSNNTGNSISVKCGETDFTTSDGATSASVTKSNNTVYEFSGDVANTNTIVVTINNPDDGKSLWTKDITITYEASGTDEVAAPTFSPAAGEVTSGTTVTISTTTTGASLYYSFVTDGTTPDAAAITTAYTAPVAITEAGTLFAKAVNGTAVEVSSATYTIKAAGGGDTPAVSGWVLTDLADLTASDEFVIVDQTGSYALPNGAQTTGKPAVVSVTLSADKKTITSEVTDALKWTISGDATNGYTFTSKAETGKYLYVTNNNAGVCVGTGENNTFLFEKVDEGKECLKTTASLSTTNKSNTTTGPRYICVYNKQDWRSYYKGSVTATVTRFYKYVSAEDAGKTATKTTFAQSEVSLEVNTEAYNAFTGLTATVTYGEDNTTLAGAAVTYTSSNTDVATVNASTGAITFGTKVNASTTITATYAGDDDYTGSDASYTLTVTDPNVKGTENNPFTVVEALAFIDDPEFDAEAEYYTKGIISSVDRFYSNYGEINYKISDDGTATNELVVYQGFGLNKAKFTALTDLEVGDKVVVKGLLTNYNSTTKEYVSAKNELVSLERKPGAALSFPEASYDIVVGNAFTAPTLSVAEGYDGTISYATSNADVAEVDATTGAVTLKGAAGTTATITATATETANFKAGEASYVINIVSKLSPNVTLSTETLSVYVGADADAVTVTTATGYTGTVTVESDEPGVASATLSEGTITVTYGTAGSATLTVTAAAAGDYDTQVKTIAVTVSEIPSINLTKKLVFTIDTSGLVDGGYDKNNDRTTVSGTFEGDATTTEFEGFTIYKVYKNNSSFQMAKASDGGALTFPIIKSEYGFDVTVAYKTNDAKIYIDDEEQDSYTAASTDATSAVLKIATYGLYCQISSITLTPKAAPVSDVDVTIGETGYATLYYGDRNLVVPEGVEAYTYSVTNNKLEESYMYSKDEVIPAKTAVVLKGEKGNYTFTVTSDDGGEDHDNMLKGADEDGLTTGGTYYYALSLNAESDLSSVGFYWVTDGGAAFNCPAHKAYLALDEKFSKNGAVRSFLLNDVQTGIAATFSGSPAEGRVYDLQGRRVSEAKQGLYIVNGKKVFVK